MRERFLVGSAMSLRSRDPPRLGDTIGSMVRWLGVMGLTVAVGAGVLGCARTCVDDGLHANQDPAACMGTTTAATTTSGATTTTEPVTSTSSTDGTSSTSDDSGSDGTTLGLTSDPGTTTTGATTTGTTTTGDGTTSETTSDTEGPPNCDDDLPGPGETGIDCGGLCPDKCDSLGGCDSGIDCMSGICHPLGICNDATCIDNQFTDGEAHVDCGGSCGSTCGLGIPCSFTSDCAPGLGCFNGHCAMNGQCGDGMQTPDETDFDCGGPMCGPSCRESQMCEFGADCISNSCVDSVCEDPQCIDGVQNHGETDINCGGPCFPCPDQAGCVVGSDCFNGECLDFICQ